MILKIAKHNGVIDYFNAEDVSAKKINIKIDTKEVLKNLKKEDLQYYITRSEFIGKIFFEESGKFFENIDFRINCEYEDLDLICIIYLLTRGKDERTIITNQPSFLMNDDGKTIDRLI